MHDPHHELPTSQQAISTTSAPDSTASWRFGHSPAGGAPEPDPAPGVAGPVRRQGAPDGEAATEGGSQPGKAGRKRRTKIKGKARPRDEEAASCPECPPQRSTSTPSSRPAPMPSA